MYGDDEQAFRDANGVCHDSVHSTCVMAGIEGTNVSTQNRCATCSPLDNGESHVHGLRMRETRNPAILADIRMTMEAIRILRFFAFVEMITLIGGSIHNWHYDIGPRFDIIIVPNLACTLAS